MKRYPKFAGVASGLLLAAIGSAMSPAFADCPCDLAVAGILIDRLPEGRQKEIAIREMKLAMAAPMLGIEKPCLPALPICVGEPPSNRAHNSLPATGDNPRHEDIGTDGGKQAVLLHNR